jgi:uncharacterized membrane protein YkvA (DUF1232 family)
VSRFLEGLRAAARRLKAEVSALAIAAVDPRTPWYARLLIATVVAYALSPIDLIPDFIPVLGLLDDLILVPLGLALALQLVPPAVMAEARAKQAAAERLPPSRWGATIIVVIWLAAAVACAVWLLA